MELAALVISLIATFFACKRLYKGSLDKGARKLNVIISTAMASLFIFSVAWVVSIGVMQAATGGLLKGAAPTDPVVDTAMEELQLAYITHVKPADASHVRCDYRHVEERHLVRCGVSFGATKTAMNGFWEVVNNGGTATTYAMNGKALRALEHIGASAAITSGAGIRPSLDIAQAEKAFAN